MNIGTDHENTSFFDLLGVILKGDGDDYEVVTIKGNCPESSQLLKYYYQGGVSPHYKVDRLLQNGATQLFSSEEGHGRMFAFEDAGYKVITSSVVIGAIASGDSLNIKPYLLGELVNYLIGFNPVTSISENTDGILSWKTYPNPFHDRTAITFSLEKSSYIRIDIFDIRGRHIQQMASGQYPEGGHTLQWDARRDGELPNGYYFCRIHADHFTITQKLLLLK